MRDTPEKAVRGEAWAIANKLRWHKTVADAGLAASLTATTRAGRWLAHSPSATIS
jgi:hypothetical protein